MNTNSTKKRSEDDTYNIYHGRSLSQTSADKPCSNSPSFMDDSPPSEMDYAKRVVLENNIKMSIAEPLIASNNPTQSYNFALPPLQPSCAINKAISNSSPNGHSSISIELSPPTVILAPMSLPTLICKMETLQQLLFSAQMNFSIVMFTTLPAPFNI